jgi:hypothetical protein
VFDGRWRQRYNLRLQIVIVPQHATSRKHIRMGNAIVGHVALSSVVGFQLSGFQPFALTLQTSEAHGGSRSSRRPYRRAKHGRRAPARTVPQCGRRSPSGDRAGSGGSLPPRHFVALWFLPYGRIARDSLHRTQEPVVLSRGDFEATCWVGLVGPVGRHVRRTTVHRRGRRAPGRVTAGYSGSRAARQLVTAPWLAEETSCANL